MDFSKENIVSKVFSKKILGGLDEFEVRDFLHVLAEEIRHLSQKISLLNKKIQDQESLLSDYRDREHILKDSIESAEKWAHKIRKEAEGRRSLILEKAHGQSSALIQEARHSLQTVYNDIANLKRLQLQFKTGLKAALQVQMDLLDQEPVYGPKNSLEFDSLSRKNFLEENSPERNSYEESPVETLQSSEEEIPSETPIPSAEKTPREEEIQFREKRASSEKIPSEKEKSAPDSEASEIFKSPFDKEELSSLKKSLENLDKELF